MNSKIRIGIIGGGVNGIGSALAILKSFPSVRVTVYAEFFTPYTTGDGAAGLWSPYICGGTDEELMKKWCMMSRDFYQSQSKENNFQVFVTQVRKVGKEEEELPFWHNIPFDFKEFNQEDLKKFGDEYVFGYSYSTYICEGKSLLPYMMNEVHKLGGSFERRSVRSLEDLAGKFDIIVNCCGIGAYELVPDKNVYPVRGQVMRIRDPNVKCATFDLSEDTFSYIIPNSNEIVVGGTHQKDDWRTSIDTTDSERMWRNAVRLEPTLKHHAIVEEWAGLRPLRKDGVRLEEEILEIGGKKTPVIHNYGHGGSGVTYFWGCSQDVRDLVAKVIHRQFEPPVRSQL